VSIRRLAKEQPASFAFTPENLEKAKWWMAKFPPGRQQSAVIAVLWLVQKQEGWVPEPALRVVADLLGMPVMRVFECVTFYTMFQLEPVGRAAFVQVCGTTPCLICGADKLIEMLEQQIGPHSHVSADGQLSWEEVECLGACANAPMAAINDYYYEDLTPDGLKALLDEFRAGRRPEPGSQLGRHGSAPLGGPKVLIDPSLYDGSRAQPIKLPNAPEPA
jgi:NADH-quinone oxidoreductase subunit E